MQKQTPIFTYCLFESGDSLLFPWDKSRLFKEQSLELLKYHMQDSTIEFYPINLLGISNTWIKMMNLFSTVKMNIVTQEKKYIV